MNPIPNGYSSKSVTEVTRQFVEIIESNELNGVDIVVLPEALLNHPHFAVTLPENSSSFCDDKDVDIVLQSISCAVRKAQMYVVISLYVKVKCSSDDQPFCSNKDDFTNLYNMAIIFDRHGDMIAK